jgi:integrase
MAKAKKLPSGSWSVNQFIGMDQNGKRIYKRFTAPTKREAEYLAAEYVAKRKAPVRADMKLTEAYSKYIEIKRNTISPTTVREYEHAAERDFTELMPLRLSQITQERVQSAVNVMSATHSPKTVRNAHGLLSAVLKMFAPEIRLTTRMPQPKRAGIHIPLEAEITQLLRSIEGTELEKAVMLAAFGSLRRSECCALMRSDIDGDTITVSKAMVWTDDHCWTIKQPKSDAGYRSIKLPSFVIEKITAGESERIVNIVPTTVTNYFAKALRKAGIEHFRFHDLRHYQASILHAMGIPDKYIMERGGWRTDSTLKNIYQHAMSDKRKEVEDDICKRFEQTYATRDTTQNNENDVST